MGEIRGIVTGCFQSYSYFIFFCAVETGSICNVAVHLFLRNQAGVVHSLPFPSLFIPCNIGIVGFAFVPAFRPEEAGYEAGGPASRNPCHFHFDAKELVRKELSGRIEASEAALSGLREKLEQAEEKKKELESLLKATKESLAETIKALDKAEDEAGQARENAEAWKNSINTLTAQLDESKDKVKEFDKVTAELAKVKADLLGVQAENKALNAVIEKFMKSSD